MSCSLNIPNLHVWHMFLLQNVIDNSVCCYAYMALMLLLECIFVLSKLDMYLLAYMVQLRRDDVIIMMRVD